LSLLPLVIVICGLRARSANCSKTLMPLINFF
jgi:hypothetical protein